MRAYCNDDWRFRIGIGLAWISIADNAVGQEPRALVCVKPKVRVRSACGDKRGRRAFRPALRAAWSSLGRLLQPERVLRKGRAGENFIWIRRNPLITTDSAKEKQGNASLFAWSQDEYKGRLAFFFEAPVFISFTPIQILYLPNIIL